ncbi:hypothetical protein HMF3257_38235 [Spirosoma telluris]|uniref:Uncharacterized protein n=1 Tax=Spirosoma telluris TaxID=2183553 RepID=A0A327NK99_9BACT|nr:hypothetical protein HMF3257_38235 [Spirosoma telluris]
MIEFLQDHYELNVLIIRPEKAHNVSNWWTTKLNGFIERKNGRFQPLPSYPATVQKNVGKSVGQDSVYRPENS